MNLFPKEYRLVLGTAITSAICISGAAAFVWHSSQESHAAILLLEKRSAEINRYRNATPPPSGEQLKQLQQQFTSLESKYRALNDKVGALDKFPVQSVSPQEFQKALNERVQNLQKKAEKNSVALPPDKDQSTENYFYLGWSDYKSKPPSPESAPALLKQLQVAEHLFSILLDSTPLAIKKIRLYKPETPAPAPAPQPKPSTGTKSDPKNAATTSPDNTPSPIQATQGYELSFSARPESLREFLNAIAKEEKAFFVTRSLRVTNNKEKEPPKKGVDGITSAAPALPAAGLLSGTNLAATGAQSQEDNSARFILGDEFVEVEMTIELLALQEAPVPKEAPKRP